MTFLRDLIHWLFPPPEVVSPAQRARVLGIPEHEIDAMWLKAVEVSTPDYAPWDIFHNLIDQWQLNHMDDITTDEVSK